jgi:hypothetical protein
MEVLASRLAPGELLVVEQFHVADWNMDQRVPIAPAGLDQDTRMVGSSIRRLAKTQPADPAPTIT